MTDANITISDADRDALIRTIYGEARNQSAEGQAAVAWVAINRLRSGRWPGDDLYDIVHQPAQFSCWNSDDPNASQCFQLSSSSNAYQEIGRLVDGIVAGRVTDPTGGADHYHTLNCQASWGDEYARFVTRSIGDHKFYNVRGNQTFTGNFVRVDNHGQPITTSSPTVVEEDEAELIQARDLASIDGVADLRRDAGAAMIRDNGGFFGMLLRSILSALGMPPHDRGMENSESDVILDNIGAMDADNLTGDSEHDGNVRSTAITRVERLLGLREDGRMDDEVAAALRDESVVATMRSIVMTDTNIENFLNSPRHYTGATQGSLVGVPG